MKRILALIIPLALSLTVVPAALAESTGDFINRIYHVSIASLDRSALEADLFFLETKVQDLRVIEQNNDLELGVQEVKAQMLQQRVDVLTQIAEEFESHLSTYQQALQTTDLDWIVTSRVELQSYMRENEIDFAVGVNAQQMVFEPSILVYEGDSLEAITLKIGMINARLNSVDNSVNYGSIPVSYPVDGTVTSNFGIRKDPFTQKPTMHSGVDIAAPTGTTVAAWFNGRVIRAENSGGWGNVVVVEQGEISVLYAHLSKISVKVGDIITQGTKVGEVGSTGRSTGPHLHLGFYINDVAVDPAKILEGK